MSQRTDRCRKVIECVEEAINAIGEDRGCAFESVFESLESARYELYKSLRWLECDDAESAGYPKLAYQIGLAFIRV